MRLTTALFSIALGIQCASAEFLLEFEGRRLVGFPARVQGDVVFVTCQRHLVPMPNGAVITFSEDAHCEVTESSSATTIVLPDPPCDGNGSGPRPDAYEFFVVSDLPKIKELHTQMLMDSARSWGLEGLDCFRNPGGCEDGSQYLVNAFVGTANALDVESGFVVQFQSGSNWYLDRVLQATIDEDCERPMDRDSMPCLPCREIANQFISSHDDWWSVWGNPESNDMVRYYSDIGDALREIGVSPDSLDSSVEEIVGDNWLLNYGFAKSFRDGRW